MIQSHQDMIKRSRQRELVLLRGGINMRWFSKDWG